MTISAAGKSNYCLQSPADGFEHGRKQNMSPCVEESNSNGMLESTPFTLEVLALQSI